MCPRNEASTGSEQLEGQVYQKKVVGYYCCEDHFNMDSDCENWQAFKLMRSKIVMKQGVVPHKYIHSELIAPKDISQLSDSARRRKVTNIVLKKESQNIQIGSSVVDKCVQVVHIMKNIGVNTPPQWQRKIVTTSRKQINVTKLSLEESSPSFRGYTTSGSFEMSVSSEEYQENEIRKNVTLQQTMQICREHSKFYLGLSEDAYFLVDLLEKHTGIAAVNILIILKKIRLNDPYYRLAIDFDTSIGTISKNLHKNLPILGKYFNSMIIWLSSEKIKLNLPIPFRSRYREVQSIIDCFEIQIEKPSNPVHQALTWSEYEKCNTLKYLISSLPDGPINYISDRFGGRITDNEIIQQSGYLNKFAFLKPHAYIDNHLICRTDDMVKIACGLINIQSSLFGK